MKSLVTSAVTMKTLATSAVVASLLSCAAMAQERDLSIDLDAVDYKSSPAYNGVETAILFGDPGGDGLYSTHARVDGGVRIPPHTHNITLTTVVTSGTAYVGIGQTFDEAALVAYPAGTYFVTPAGAPHFIAAMDGDFSILDHGSGPVSTALVKD